MESASDATSFRSGYEAALEDALRLVDGLRGPGGNNLATPILLRIRSELIALREDRESRRAA